jgi:hypothetical protein
MDGNSLLPDVLTRFGAKPKPNDSDDETVAPGNAYAVARGPRQPPALKFIRSTGRSFSLSYGYLPIPWWETPDALLIEYPGLFTVSLAGLDLAVLQARLCDYRVTWIRECDPSSASLLPSVVTRIEIIHTYPSREEGDGGKAAFSRSRASTALPA